MPVYRGRRCGYYGCRQICVHRPGYGMDGPYGPYSSYGWYGPPREPWRGRWWHDHEHDHEHWGRYEHEREYEDEEKSPQDVVHKKRRMQPSGSRPPMRNARSVHWRSICWRT